MMHGQKNIKLYYVLFPPVPYIFCFINSYAVS